MHGLPHCDVQCNVQRAQRPPPVPPPSTQVWNQTLKFPLADASPDEESPTLKVKVKQNNYLRFDKCVCRVMQGTRPEGMWGC